MRESGNAGAVARALASARRSAIWLNVSPSRGASSVLGSAHSNGNPSRSRSALRYLEVEAKTTRLGAGMALF
jgi:hypothetical protein